MDSHSDPHAYARYPYIIDTQLSISIAHASYPSIPSHPTVSESIPSHVHPQLPRYPSILPALYPPSQPTASPDLGTNHCHAQALTVWRIPFDAPVPCGGHWLASISLGRKARNLWFLSRLSICLVPQWPGCWFRRLMIRGGSARCVACTDA